MNKISGILFTCALILFSLISMHYIIPSPPANFSIVNHSVTTPYFVMQFPAAIDRGQGGEDSISTFYRFLSPPYNESAPQQMVIKIYSEEDGVSKDHILKYELGRVASLLIHNPSVEEGQAIHRVFSQSPQRFMVNGVPYSMLGITLRNTQFVILLSTIYEKVYVFELVSRNDDGVQRESNMNALASSVNNIRYIQTVSEFKQALWIAISGTFLIITLCLYLWEETLHSLTSLKALFVGGNSIGKQMQEALDVKNDPALSKYRVDPESAIGKKKLKGLTIYWICMMVICLFLALFMTSDYWGHFIAFMETIPGVHFIYPFTLWHWVLLGLLFLMSILMIRMINFIPMMLVPGISIEISCLIIGILWPELEWLKMNQNLSIFLLAASISVPLYKLIDMYFNEYLKKNYVGKTFELTKPIETLKNSSILIQSKNIGRTRLGGFTVVVVGDDLFLPVSSLIKVVGIDQKLKCLVIERA